MLISVAILLGLAVTAPAQTTGHGATNSAAGDSGAVLDDLFVQLKRAGNEASAQRISRLIRQQWSQSGSATIDLLMTRANKAVEGKKYDAALDYLDEIVTLAPAYAEGWNLRATVHFAADDYGRAMADIDRTLRLEPRHFGALTGMAAILKATGHNRAAAAAYERLLDVYPMMRDAQTEFGRLADEMAGQGI
jgi:tetratricopeptide (TPR) repeat protein